MSLRTAPSSILVITMFITTTKLFLKNCIWYWAHLYLVQLHFIIALVTLEHIIMLGQIVFPKWISGFTLTFDICMPTIHKYFGCEFLAGILHYLHVETLFLYLCLSLSLCFYSGTLIGWGPLSKWRVTAKDCYIKGQLCQRTIISKDETPPPHKPSLNTCRSRCRQMSPTLHVLLEAEPCLEGDVADGNADINLARQLSCSILEGR